MEFEPFSGTYDERDVQVLLQVIEFPTTPVEVKERQIQAGRHYSEMIGEELIPTTLQMDVYERSLMRYQSQIARQCVSLAKTIISASERGIPIILVSLVRAGLPIGVILRQTIADLGHDALHFGVSIIRDRGIDDVAMSAIEKRWGTRNIFFIDGWTGKGAIASELKEALSTRGGYEGEPKLVVLSDLCGAAWLAAGGQDWLMPFGVLGAPIAGMISRSIWRTQGLHACVVPKHVAHCDRSVEFIARIKEERGRMNLSDIEPAIWSKSARLSLQETADEAISRIAREYKVKSTQLIKPGIAEASRAVLRRVPDVVLVSDIDDPDLELLLSLARDRHVNIKQVNTLGRYRAVTIIRSHNE